MSGQDARDVIAAHERVHGMRLATCKCGWEEPIRGRDVTVLHAAHQLDALTAAGFAIVKLPEPIHRCDRDVAWLSRDDEIQVDYDSRRSSICVSYPDGSDIPIYGPWDADRALDVGTALIAAHAEAGEGDD
ncbi:MULTISPECIES: hypothetical protein [Gordonia]|uniref:Uncharacterized protein n=1 Tax=Gordonia sihwensis NBRC 108236 TaxID=1223544 RepID=L7LIQ6_9ACTN|nr:MULTISPECIES: hypothetical protein [Gordonia]AUH68495.1 hypothetical protein CXX93_09210 [Gordonia sp. YC-JH1]GAC60621.1 hypothetical protein GSI01S_10_02140 [Gordonia sihwensis NBRC 108236]